MIAITVPSGVADATGARDVVMIGAPSLRDRGDHRFDVAHEDLHVRRAGIPDLWLRRRTRDVREFGQLEVEALTRQLQHRHLQADARRVGQNRDGLVRERAHLTGQAEDLGVERERLLERRWSREWRA